MVSNRITEGVGKKIVEALKQQSDIEIKNVVDNSAQTAPEPVVGNEPEIEFTNNTDEDMSSDISFNDEPIVQQEPIVETNDYIPHKFTMPNTMANTMSFNQPAQTQTVIEKDNFASDLEGFEIPTNIAVLKQLINQLPAGVSKQTGALIIKQTMEALGISMKSVLQEAQQVQESLNNSARECQASIMEYKKQISVLEKQAQKFQRQYSALNDIISLFIQTSI